VRPRLFLLVFPCLGWMRLLFGGAGETAAQTKQKKTRKWGQATISVSCSSGDPHDVYKFMRENGHPHLLNPAFETFRASSACSNQGFSQNHLRLQRSEEGISSTGPGSHALRSKLLDIGQPHPAGAPTETAKHFFVAATRFGQRLGDLPSSLSKSVPKATCVRAPFRSAVIDLETRLLAIFGVEKSQLALTDSRTNNQAGVRAGCARKLVGEN
jgi:hypothetical protein